jgi:NAD(P)-dependent dehydrogenase (short-subunit alcohol dehydrogenase family)
MSVAGKPDPVALVTGAETGLGREIARQLSARNIAVVVTARETPLAEVVRRELKTSGGTAWAVQLDVCDDASVARAVREVTDRVGSLDILINNAGICMDSCEGPLGTDLAVVRKTLETNLLGAWRVSQAFVPLLRHSIGGRIVNISSTMGQLETMGTDSPAYRVSKTALNALTAMLASELASTQVLVNAADPGWIRTDMGGPNAPLSVEDGAQTPVWLATLPNGSPTGGFYFRRRLIAW